MIAFTTTSAASTSLKAMLTSTVTTSNLQATAWYHDVLRQVKPDDAPFQTVPQYAALSTGSTEVSILDAPNSGTNRFVDSVAIYNADTVSAEVTVFMDDGTNRVQRVVTLGVKYTLNYEGGEGGHGWYVTDANGANVEASTEVSGSWTPTLTFATPGDLNVVYSTRAGYYKKVGGIVTYSWNIVTSTFTHGTASGNAQITGFPFTSANVTSIGNRGSMQWAGITKANYTHIMPNIAPNTVFALLNASGSGQAAASVTSADMPTGGTVQLSGTLICHV